MKLSKAQSTISEDTSRFKVVVAGRRFGKSFLAINEMAKFARFPKKNVYYVAPTYRQAKTIIWDTIKAMLTEKKWVKKVNESDLNITLVNGSKIFLRSADNFDSLRGVSIDYLVIDEAAMIAKKAWSEVLRPALSDRLGHAMFITTPKGMNWIKELWDDAHHLKDWQSFQYTTIDGGNVLESEITAARADLGEKEFRQEYEASFETYSGIIYYNYNPKINVVETVEEINERTLIHAAIDFNVNPMTCALATIDRDDNIHIFDEIILYSSNTYEMADEINAKFPTNRIWAYPDASGQARKTSSTTSDHHILRQAGFVIKANRSNPPVRDRISAVNACLLNANGVVSLTMDPKCKQTMKSLSNQTYIEGSNMTPDKNSGLDHMSDSVGYLVHFTKPIKPPQPTQQLGPFGMKPKRFGHF